MKLKFPFFGGSSPEPETPEEPKIVAKVINLDQELSSLFTYGKESAATPTSALALYEQSSAVAVPVNLIAEHFAEIQPVLEINENEYVTKHPVLELLQEPSPFFSGYLFKENLAKNFLVTDEAYVIALGSKLRPPGEIQPISPKNVSVHEGAGGYASMFDITGNTLTGSYKQDLKGRKLNYYHTSNSFLELKQIRGFSTKNNSLLRGQSKLVSASAEARQHILGNKHNVSILEKGGRVSLVFHYDENLDNDNFAELKKRVRSEVAGAENAGAVIVSTGGKMTVQEMAKNNKDMDFANLQRMAMNSCALTWKVPLPLVTSDAQTFNNYKTAKIALYDDAVLPLADFLYGALGSFLLPRYGLDPRQVRITYDVLTIPALRERALDELKMRKDIGIESDNELRPMIARKPYEGGDIIFKPSSMVPVSDFLIDPAESEENVALARGNQDEEDIDEDAEQ